MCLPTSATAGPDPVKTFPPPKNLETKLFPFWGKLDNYIPVVAARNQLAWAIAGNDPEKHKNTCAPLSPNDPNDQTFSYWSWYQFSISWIYQHIAMQCIGDSLLKWDVPSNFANSCFCSLVSLVLISSLVRWSHWSPCAQKSGPGGPLDFLFRTISFNFLTICVWICSWLRFRLALCLLKKQLEIPAQWPLATQQIFSSRKHIVIEKLKCC